MTEENCMGTMPVLKLFNRTSVPRIISLLVNNLYNLVESIFVARASEVALTGISLAAPLQTIIHEIYNFEENNTLGNFSYVNPAKLETGLQSLVFYLTFGGSLFIQAVALLKIL